jgi:hypothetical protein
MMSFKKQSLGLSFALFVLLFAYNVFPASVYDYSNPQVTRYNLSLFNMVRHGYYYGQKIDFLDPSYKYNFTDLGTEYVEVFLHAGEMSKISPSENVYDYSDLDDTIGDIVSMGFKPHIRFGEIPEWIQPSLGEGGTLENQQIKVIKDPVKRQKFIKVAEDTASHLTAKYGSETSEWAFSALNERALYHENLSGGNWDTGSQYMAVFYHEFSSGLKSTDPSLKVGGAIESVNYYELWYFLDYLNRTGQKSMLEKIDYVSFHQYGAYGRSDGTDAALDQAIAVNSYVADMRRKLDGMGLGRIELWEGEANFNAYQQSDEPRCANYIGGLYDALNIVSNSQNGVVNVFHWTELSSGPKTWLNGPPRDSYYAYLLLNEKAVLRSGTTYYAAAPGSSNLSAYGLKNPLGQYVLVLFNRRNQSFAGEDIEIRLPSSYSGSNISLEVYKYGPGRISDSLTKYADIGPLTLQASAGIKLASFQQTLDPYSMNVYIIADGNKAPRIDYLRAWDNSHGQWQLASGECMHRGDSARIYVQFSDDRTANQDMQIYSGGSPRLWAGTNASSDWAWNLIDNVQMTYNSSWDNWHYDWTIPSTAPFDSNGIEYLSFRTKDSGGSEVSGWQTDGGFSICCSPINHTCAADGDCCSGICSGAQCSTERTTTTTTNTISTTTSSTTTSSTTTSLMTTSTTTTTSSTSTTSTTTTKPCALTGNFPPCNEVSLQEIIDAINAWGVDEFALTDVIALINAWASA